MNTSIEKLSSTQTKLTIVADDKDLSDYKQAALKEVGKDLKIPGFREGNVPATEVEKHADQAKLNDTFLNAAVPPLVEKAVNEHKLSPSIAPNVAVTKFVPFSAVEMDVTIDHLGEVKLADYTKVKRKNTAVKVDKKDIDTVYKRIQMDLSEKSDVKRAAKDGDQVWIDFDGKDAKGEAIQGAAGKDYPLAIGTNTFIPGFEDEMIGMSAGDNKEFTLTFPKDYGVAAMANKKVTFTVTVNKVQEVVIPDVDDAFAAKVGPYKTVKELEADVVKNITREKEQRARMELESSIMEELVNGSEIELPEGLINQQIHRMQHDHQRNLAQRGQTYEDWLKAEGKTTDDHVKDLRPGAVDRLKGGIVLSEFARAEGIKASDAEIEAATSQYRQQFANDPKMQEQLKTPRGKQDITARLLTDKSLRKLVDSATS